MKVYGRCGRGMKVACRICRCEGRGCGWKGLAVVMAVVGVRRGGGRVVGMVAGGVDSEGARCVVLRSAILESRGWCGCRGLRGLCVASSALATDTDRETTAEVFNDSATAQSAAGATGIQDHE